MHSEDARGEPGPRNGVSSSTAGFGMRRSLTVRRCRPAPASPDRPIVEQYDTTTLVPHGFVVTVDRFGNLVGEFDNGG